MTSRKQSSSRVSHHTDTSTVLQSHDHDDGDHTSTEDCDDASCMNDTSEHPLPSHRSNTSIRAETCGFIIYLGSAAAAVFYTLWAVLDDSVLHALGIYYYPQRFVSISHMFALACDDSLF